MTQHEMPLFSTKADSNQMSEFQPLADRMRPQSIDEIVGQQHLLGKEKPLYKAIKNGQLHSMILWGPPGTGKTTLARLVAQHSDANFMSLSAVLSGVKDIRKAVDDAKQFQQQFNRTSVLFVDEVHRFNKAQQDAFLPFIEDGTITFVGATTENPSFELNNALLSRARVYVLKPLDTEDIKQLINSAIANKEKGLNRNLNITETALNTLANFADGDARRALTLLEVAADFANNNELTEKDLDAVLSTGSTRRFDKGGEAFYDQISALHKSVRGSDPDASLYWLCRMLDGGCDPRYLARRIARMSTEDIGNADPRALTLCLNAWDIQERLGSPEGELALAQAVVYLAVAPKSNAVYIAFKRAMQAAKESGSLEVPLHLRNAPTKLMKELDYGKDYRYAHDEEDAFAAGETYLPEELTLKQQFYKPTERGLEKTIKEKLEKLRELNKNTNT